MSKIEYTRELSDLICERIADGESLSAICREPGMPGRRTVNQWSLDDRDGFHARYARARELQLAGIADELLDIADDATNDFMKRQIGEAEVMVVDHEHINRSRLRVESRKWLLTKLMPSTFGEKVETTHKTDEAFLALWQKMS